MSETTNSFTHRSTSSYSNHSIPIAKSVQEYAIVKADLRPEMIAAAVGIDSQEMSMALAPLVQMVYEINGSPEAHSTLHDKPSEFANVIHTQFIGNALPFKDASLDVLFATMDLLQLFESLLSIQEMTRVLKPGGRLVLSCWLRDSDEDSKIDNSGVSTKLECEQVRVWLKEADLVNIIVDWVVQSSSMEHQGDSTAEQTSSANPSAFVATGTRRLKMREAVKEAYGARAASGGSCCEDKSIDILNSPLFSATSSCCGESSPCCCSDAEQTDFAITFNSGYNVEEKAVVPGEAGEFSLGCGNPTAFANLRPGEIVLDIGSGGGMDAFIAAARIGPTGTVIGVDMTPAMLERARLTAQKAGILNVEFRQGQAENLPVADQSVDVILSNCVINLCEDKGLVFQEAFRVLKPGGRLEISDMVTDRLLPLTVRREDWAGCIAGALPEQEYLDLVAQAGFGEITARKSTSSGNVEGVAVYSITVSARKP